MADTEEHALAPDALQRVTPRRWMIDLRTEGLGDAPYEEILSPGFWIEAKDAVRYRDIVTLVRSDASTLDIFIGMPHPDGGLYVSDLGRTVPPHPELASRLAAKSPQEAA